MDVESENSHFSQKSRKTSHHAVTGDLTGEKNQILDYPFMTYKLNTSYYDKEKYRTFLKCIFDDLKMATNNLGG